MLKQDYLELKKSELEELKRYHSSYLKAYKNELQSKNDPQIVDKIEKKEALFLRKEEKFLTKAEKRNKQVKHRIWELDLIKALIIFFMLIDHLIQDFDIFFPDIFSKAYIETPFFADMQTFAIHHLNLTVRLVSRFVGIMVLAMIIGINTHFSRNNWKRFGILFAFGVGFNVFYAVCAQFNILGYSIMNIIMSYSLSMLVYCIFETIFSRFKKAWKWICLGFGVGSLIIFGFVLYSRINPPTSGLDNWFWFIFHGSSNRVHKYDTFSEMNFTAWVEMIYGTKRFGQEWLGLFPICGYVFIGAFIGQTLYKDKKSLLRFFDKEGEVTTNEKFNRTTGPFLLMGRKAVLFYLLHQPVFTIIMWFIVSVCMGIPLAF